MKTTLEIEMKKIRKQLKDHSRTEEERAVLRKTLEEFKVLSKKEKIKIELEIKKDV